MRMTYSLNLSEGSQNLVGNKVQTYVSIMFEITPICLWGHVLLKTFHYFDIFSLIKILVNKSWKTSLKVALTVLQGCLLCLRSCCSLVSTSDIENGGTTDETSFIVWRLPFCLLSDISALRGQTYYGVIFELFVDLLIEFPILRVVPHEFNFLKLLSFEVPLFHLRCFYLLAIRIMVDSTIYLHLDTCMICMQRI